MLVLGWAKMERTMKNIVEKWDLAPDLSISQVLIPLWQIADHKLIQNRRAKNQCCNWKQKIAKCDSQ